MKGFVVREVRGIGSGSRMYKLAKKEGRRGKL